MKVGLPNYSNITARADLTADIGENEQIDWDKLWDTLNQQLGIQSNSIDPSWIVTKEYSRFFKTVIKSPKQEEK